MHAAPVAPIALDSYKYVGFEDQFRGSQDDIRERVAAYVPLFEGATDVLDVGCGRGEFLELLRHKGISARGIDLNDEMAAVCRERGLDAWRAMHSAIFSPNPTGRSEVCLPRRSSSIWSRIT